MSPGTEEPTDRIQPERISRLGRQGAILGMPQEGQGLGHVGSPRSSQTTCSMWYVRHMIYGPFCS